MSTNSLPTISEWLRRAVKHLREAGIGTARLDSLVLLEDVTGYGRAWVLAHPQDHITAQQNRRLDRQVAQRKQHIPLAYIRGKSEFYGRDFMVNRWVLEPRPESETMIDLLKDSFGPGGTVIDIGTGSGALAITAKLELPSADVFAVDVDQRCLVVAKKNAEHLKATVRFCLGNLLDPLPSLRLPIFFLCNLPYVPDNFQINQAALHEPRIAIFGGHDGLDVYRALFAQLARFSPHPISLLTESMPPQHQSLRGLAQDAGFRLQTAEDFIQLFRKP